MRDYLLHSNREICWTTGCSAKHREVRGITELHEIAEYFASEHSLRSDIWETSVIVAPRGQAFLAIRDDGNGYWWELMVNGMAIRSGELDAYGMVLTPEQLDKLEGMLKLARDVFMEIDSIEVY